MTDPKRGFDLAFAAMCEVKDFDAAESHLGHAMEDLYRLYELAGEPPLTKAKRSSRDAALEATDVGKTALAVVWARKFRTHEVAEVSQAADMYSDYYTNLYGVLAWRPRSDFTDDTDGRGWHLFYDTYLQGRPVLDTLQAAISAVVAVLSGP